MEPPQQRYAIIFFGPPGCGKGTQADFIFEKLDFFNFSTGNVLRKEIASESALGRKIKSFCDVGELVPDEIVIDLLKKIIEPSTINRLLFDGFPRTLNQANVLSEVLSGWYVRVFNFCVDEKIVVNRILSRFVCEECGVCYNDAYALPKIEGICDKCGETRFKRRSDDKAEVILSRLDNYKKKTEPVLDFYKKEGLVSSVDASKGIDEVFSQITSLIEGMLFFDKENLEWHV
jgi:adenylate kinase